MKRHITLMGDLGSDATRFLGICDKARRNMGDIDDNGGFFAGTPLGLMDNLVSNPQAVAQQVQNDPAALQELAQASGTPPSQVLQAAQQATGSGSKNYSDPPGTGPSMVTVSATASRGALTTGSKVALVAVLGAVGYYVSKAKGWI